MSQDGFYDSKSEEERSNSSLSSDSHFQNHNDAIKTLDFTNETWIEKSKLSVLTDAYLNGDDEKVSTLLKEIGGLRGLEKGLKTDCSKGILEARKGDKTLQKGLEIRREIYGMNKVHGKPPKKFWELCLIILEDFMLQLLIIAGIVSIPLGISDDPEEGWIDGTAILLAVCVVVFVGALNDYSKDQQFREMEKKSQEKSLNVFRGSSDSTIEIPQEDVVCGDVLRISEGTIVPVDGLLCSSYGDVACDEGIWTGETNSIKKSLLHPVILKGTKIESGTAYVVTTGVGHNSEYGKLMTRLLHNEQDLNENENSEIFKGFDPDKETDLQRRLNDLAEIVGNMGLAAAVLLFHILLYKELGEKEKEKVFDGVWHGAIFSVALFIGLYVIWKRRGGYKPSSQSLVADAAVLEYQTLSVEDGEDEDESSCFSLNINDYALKHLVLASVCLFFIYFDVESCIRFWEKDFLDFLIVAITIIVVAIPEGLPLAVTVSMSYSMKKMLKDNNFVRQMDACEIMGNATTLLSDKTGTLTSNQLKICVLHAGDKTIYDTNVGDINDERETGKDITGQYSPSFIRILQVALCSNTSSVVSDSEGKYIKFENGSGNSVDKAVVRFAMLSLGIRKEYLAVRKSQKIIKAYPFDSRKKFSVVIIENKLDSTYTLFIKGAPEIIIDMCSDKLVSNNEEDSIHMEELDGYSMEDLQKNVNNLTSNGYRVVGMAMKEFARDECNWNEYGAPKDINEILKSGLTFLSLLGMEDPLRDEVPSSVLKVQNAGITVRMVTGDNLQTAINIAEKCHIYDPSKNHLAWSSHTMKQKFQLLSSTNDEIKAQVEKDFENLRVVARSRPEDKADLVKYYMSKGHVVAVTGDGANDALALKTADVGLAMNIAGTEVAKEASDIVIMDDNFKSIEESIKWGRIVFDNIRKFVQFQLTVNVVALLLSCIASFWDEFSMPLTAVQLLWVNLIMDTLAALALATDHPTDELFNRRPYSKNEPLISSYMWRFVFVHSVYQLTILLFILLVGEELFACGSSSNFEHPDDTEKGRNETLLTIIFNTFVFLQIFNFINARKVNGESDLFSGLLSNIPFLLIEVFIITTQVLLIEFGGKFADTTSLTTEQWFACVGIGSTSMIVGKLCNCVPIGYFEG